MLFATYFVLAFILLKLPIIRQYTQPFNVLIHEVGHMVATLITGGKTHNIEIYKNGEGVAFTQSKSLLDSIFVSLSGYLFSPFLAYILIVLLFNDLYKVAFWIIVSIVCVALIFWIRNFYGFIWSILFLTILFVIFFQPYSVVLIHSLYIIVALLFVDAIVSSFTLLKLSWKDPASSGDAYNLKKITYIPSVFYGLFFFSVNILLVVSSINFWS